uniref:Uncharacterized protein n=1 Tax=Rhizophora mucronata TaxID=61149 RepID=A0A2P2N949_RHIMU
MTEKDKINPLKSSSPYQKSTDEYQLFNLRKKILMIHPCISRISV